MKRAIALSTLLLLAGLAAQAESGFIAQDVVYGHKDGMALVFDVYKPDVEPNGAGVVLVVSGGFFSTLGMQQRLIGLAEPVLDAGFTVFAVRHGSGSRYNVPEAHADVDKAFRHIRSTAADYGVDPARLGVMGISAGGHLSLMLGLKTDADASDRPAAVVAYMPPVDLKGLTGPSDRFPALDFDAKLASSVSPIEFVTADDPPVLLIHGDADELVPISNSEDMQKALQAVNVANKLVVIEGAGHGAFYDEDKKRADAAVADWFKVHLLQNVDPSHTD